MNSTELQMRLQQYVLQGTTAWLDLPTPFLSHPHLEACARMESSAQPDQPLLSHALEESTVLNTNLEP